MISWVINKLEGRKMELNLEALSDMAPFEAMPIIFQQQIEEGILNAQDFEEIGYATGLIDYCLPTCTQDKSEKLVTILKLSGQVNPLYFYMLQLKFNEKLRKMSDGVMGAGTN